MSIDFQQMGLEEAKEWLAAHDEVTVEFHRAFHKSLKSYVEEWSRLNRVEGLSLSPLLPDTGDGRPFNPYRIMHRRVFKLYYCDNGVGLLVANVIEPDGSYVEVCLPINFLTEPELLAQRTRTQRAATVRDDLQRENYSERTQLGKLLTVLGLDHHTDKLMAELEDKTTSES